MKTAIINLRKLKAVARAASTEETRYYLNGVCLEIGESAVNYVATNGHILLCGRHGLVDEVNTLRGVFIIPNDVVASIKLKKNGHEIATLRGDGSHALSLEHEGRSIGFRAIYGTFPNWRRIVPMDSRHEKDYGDNDEIGFNPDYLMALHKAGVDADSAIGSHCSFTLMPRGQAPALVYYRTEELFGVIMPYHSTSRRGDKRPGWIEEAILDVDYSPPILENC